MRPLARALFLLSLSTLGRQGLSAASDDPIFASGGIPSLVSLSASMRDGKVPTPESFLGAPIGTRFSTPEQIVAYVRAVGAASNRVRVDTYGHTPEGRELVLVTISSPENLARLEQIRTDLKSLSDPALTESDVRLRSSRTPPVVWLACSVHGDEAAGAEAGLAVLYRLAASNETDVLSQLANVVVVIDPCVNPDGRGRHVAWWRSVAGPEVDDDPDALENDPEWPEGRTNHNGFDLNRDWAWATQPETRARIAAIRATPPQVYVDAHEMFPEGTYFFPPDAEPVHPSVAPETKRWLDTFGRANAKAFDERGWSYFNREVYDLFYPAYGDSWPSLRGAVGMTYEMAASGGIAYRRKDGSVLTLKERALKHSVALLATVATAAAHHAEILLDYAAFFRNSVKEGRDCFVIPADQDPARIVRLARLLEMQGVRVEETLRPIARWAGTGAALPAGSLLIDSAQPFGRLAQALLEPNAQLPAAFLKEQRQRLLFDEPDSFYDVTAWSLPLAYGLRSTSTRERALFAQNRTRWQERVAAVAEAAAQPAYGWLFRSDDSESRLAAGRLLVQGLRVLATTRDSMIAGVTIPAGSFLIRRENNDSDRFARVQDIATTASRPIRLKSAWTDEGPSFGSNSLLVLKVPRVILLTGDGADVSSVGSIRLAIERDLGIHVMRRRASALSRTDLTGVTAIIVPHGGGAFRRELEREEGAAALRRWVEGGGVVIGIRDGAEILRGKSIHLSEVKAWEPPKPPDADTKARPDGAKAEGQGNDGSKSGEPARGERSAAGSEKVSKGALPATSTSTSTAEPSEDGDLLLDLDHRPLSLPGAALRTRGAVGHPLLFGASPDPIFLVFGSHPPKRLLPAKGNVVSVVRTNALAAGFAWKEALERWSGAPVVQWEEVGRGKVISFAGDPAFRGTWLGTEILLLNAVLLAPSVDRS
ncbi:MAG: M14 family zinc carboxypeptidase [Thermoanaerobaculia bacterium]